MNSILRFTRILLPVLLFVTFAAGCSTRRTPAPSLPSTGGAYSHDTQGLEKQYAPFLKALAKRDPASMDAAYKVFLIPEPDKWFAAYFKKENVEQLGWDEEAENESEKKSMVTITNLVGRGVGFHAHCTRPPAGAQTKLAPRADAFLPLQPVPVEQFHIDFIGDNGKRFSILANFVYVDGAFRFLGKGAYPFWSMPDATAPKH